MGNTIEIRRWDNDKVIFSHTCENNTIGKTLEKAVNLNVDLSYAKLTQYNFRGLNLQGAKLSYANLIHSCFYHVDLQGADLSYSNLKFAIFDETNLLATDLSNANLHHADLGNILNNLNFTYLVNTKGLNDQCPKEGSFIGWKKCFNSYRQYIVKLEIPADAKRCSGTGVKCRCDKAKVLEIQYLDGGIAFSDRAYSYRNGNFIYEKNTIVYPDSFDNRFWIECSHGIHFFMNRDDAVRWLP